MYEFAYSRNFQRKYVFYVALDEKYRFGKTETLLKPYRNLELYFMYSFNIAEITV